MNVNRHFWTNWVIGHLYKNHKIIQDQEVEKLTIRDIVDIVVKALEDSDSAEKEG